MADLQKFYQGEVRKKLQENFGYKNNLEIPKVERVVLNIGVGEATGSSQVLEKAISQLTIIAGQKPKITKAKRSISTFKLRKGMSIGVSVTLRGKRMYNFLTKLFSIVLPRIRDFRGVSEKSFDGRGNYTLGIKEQTIFSEIDYSQVDKLRGLEVTIVTTAKSDEEAKKLLELLGMPFAGKAGSG